MEVVAEVVRSTYVPNKKRTKNGQPTYVWRMLNGHNEFVPYKKRSKRSMNDQRMHMSYSSMELSYLS